MYQTGLCSGHTGFTEEITSLLLPRQEEERSSLRAAQANLTLMFPPKHLALESDE